MKLETHIIIAWHFADLPDFVDFGFFWLRGLHFEQRSGGLTVGLMVCLVRLVFSGRARTDAVTEKRWHTIMFNGLMSGEVSILSTD